MTETNEFAENLTGKDVKSISKNVGCSISTVYKYLSGDIPDNGIGKRTYEQILDCAKTILMNRGENLLVIANSIKTSL